MTLAPEYLAPIKIACDASAFELSIAELAQLLVDAPDAFVEAILGLPNGVCDLVRLDSDRSGTTGADKLTVTMQPTELMNRLMAAARAGDFNLSVFDHVSSSDGCLNNSIEGSPPGESQSSPGGHPQPNPARPTSSDS